MCPSNDVDCYLDSGLSHGVRPIISRVRGCVPGPEKSCCHNVWGGQTVGRVSRWFPKWARESK